MMVSPSRTQVPPTAREAEFAELAEDLHLARVLAERRRDEFADEQHRRGEQDAGRAEPAAELRAS